MRIVWSLFDNLGDRAILFIVLLKVLSKILAAIILTTCDMGTQSTEFCLEFRASSLRYQKAWMKNFTY